MAERLNHPNTVRFIDTFKTQNAQYIFMEFCDEGDLLKFIPKFNKEKFGIDYVVKTLKEDDARYVIREVVLGLNYLNSNLIMHRDIKLENIMVKKKPSAYRNEDGQIQISDFEFKVGDVGIGKKLDFLEQQT